MKPEGRKNHPVNLTQNTAIDEDPACSPDGRFIAFSSNRSLDYEIWRMRADGTDQVNLTLSSGSIDRQSSWQPIP